MQMFVIVLTMSEPMSVKVCLCLLFCQEVRLVYLLLLVCSDGRSSGINIYAYIQRWFKMGLSGTAGLLHAEEHALDQNKAVCHLKLSSGLCFYKLDSHVILLHQQPKVK